MAKRVTDLTLKLPPTCDVTLIAPSRVALLVLQAMETKLGRRLPNLAKALNIALRVQSSPGGKTLNEMAGLFPSTTLSTPTITLLSNPPKAVTP